MSARVPTFSAELQRLTQLAYLMGVGASLVSELNSRTVSSSVASRIQGLCRDGRTVKRAKLTSAQVKKSAADLPAFLSEVLLVQLVALLHRHLGQQAGYGPSDKVPSVEDLISRSKISTEVWWFRD